MKGGKKGLIRTVVGAVVALVFAWLAFGKMDWAASGSALAKANFGFIALGVVLLAADYALRIVRWWLLLRAVAPGEVRLGQCVRPYLGSMAMNNVLPMRAGDVMRTFGFQDELRVPPMSVLGTMVIERLMDLTSLLAVFFAGLTLVPTAAVPDGFRKGATIAVGACIVILVAILVSPSFFARRVEEARARAEAAQEERKAKVLGGVADLLDSLKALRSPVLSIQTLGLSFAAWALEGGLFVAVGTALGFVVPTLGYYLSLATGTLATLIPGSPGHVGTFDYFAGLGLKAFGVGGKGTALFALVVHVLLWTSVTLAGALFLATRSLRKASAVPPAA